MDAVEKMELFGNLVYVSIAIAVIGFGLAVLFFFLFDIRDLYAWKTGKAKRSTIERMTEQNNKTGRLHATTGKTGNNPAPVRYESNVSTAEMQPKAQMLNSNINETVDMRRDNETTVLHSFAAETTVLNSQDQGDTTILTEAPKQAEPAIRFEITESTLVIHTDEFI